MAEIRRSGTWGSALTSDEFAAIRTVGFEPVGQVLGAAVYNIGYTGGYGCPGAWGGYCGYGIGPAGRTQVSSRGGYGSFGAAGPDACTRPGARRSAGWWPSAPSSAGTAWSASGSPSAASRPAASSSRRSAPPCARPARRPLKRPFTSDLSGQDFAKLVTSGWVPAGLVARHLDRGQARRLADRRPDPLGRGQRRGQRLDRAGQRRPPRRPACSWRRTSSGIGAEGVVIADMDHAGPRAGVPGPGGRPRPHRRGGQHRHRDRRASRPQAAGHGPPPLAIMSLDPKRRQAARVDIGQNRR